jgi:hypothetical protein
VKIDLKAIGIALWVTISFFGPWILSASHSGYYLYDHGGLLSWILVPAAVGAFLFYLLRVMRSEQVLESVLIAVCASTVISFLGFGAGVLAMLATCAPYNCP